MPFHRRRDPRQVISSVKNVVDLSSTLVATTNTLLSTIIVGRDVTDRGTNPFEVDRGSKVFGFYRSLFFAQDVNAAAAAIPLLDWYCLVDKGGNLSGSAPTFGNGVRDLPIPGSTGTASNVNKVIHEEKGLIGEKNDGSKMVFQGVIRIPRGMQKINVDDRVVIVARANDEAIFCLKCIYKFFK